MIRSLTVLTLLSSLLAIGCASKKDLEAAQAQLANCQEEKAEAEAKVNTWEQRFDRESQRWEQMQASITDAVPNALAEIDAEKKRILELVPEQVQYEVSSYLEEYFGTMMKAFDALRSDNEEVKTQLAATRNAMEGLGTDTRSITTAIDDALAVERGRRQQVARGLEALFNQIAEFDQTRINCASCGDRIKLNKKEREAVLGFHTDLANTISSLQTTLSGMDVPRPVRTPTPSTDAMTDDSMGEDAMGEDSMEGDAMDDGAMGDEAVSGEEVGDEEAGSGS